MIAYDYPLLGFFWSMLMLFLFVAWILLLLRVFGDIFRRASSGWTKALWSLFVIVTPLLGTLVYLIVNGHEMVGRDVEAAVQQQNAVESYIREVAGPPLSSADELEKLASLRDRGVISDVEFDSQKARLLT